MIDPRRYKIYLQIRENYNRTANEAFALMRFRLISRDYQKRTAV